jgi:hypothetical protein
MARSAEGFYEDEVAEAFEDADESCECCGKRLSWESRHRSDDHRSTVWGRWEAHHGGRQTPVILCVGEPENCHLNCGHEGSYRNEGITPQYHRGGGYER